MPPGPAPPTELDSQEPAPAESPVSASQEAAAERAAPETAPPAPPDPLLVDSATVRFKPGKGLSFKSRDGEFELALRSRLQLRHELVHDSEADPRTTHLLMVRRARVNITGHMFGEHNRYKLQLALSPRDMQFGAAGAARSPVLDAVVEFDHLSDLTLSAGQFMVPFNRQRIVSSGDFELVDRSIASGEFHLDRDVGLQLSSNDLAGLGALRYLIGVFNGEGRDANQMADGGLLYVVRVEALPQGNAKTRWDYEEGDLERVSTPRVSLGAAYARHQQADNDRGIMGRPPTDGGTTDFDLLTADAVAHWLGLSLMGEAYYRRGKREFGNAMTTDDAGLVAPAAREPARDGFGWFVQGGYILPSWPLGVAARYSRVRGTAGSSLPDSDEVGGGPSWYIGGHDLKLQLDYFRHWSESFGGGSDAVRTQLTAGF